VTGRDPSSFRDPDSAVVVRDGIVLRELAPSYAPAYGRLMQSGLYEHLVSGRLLVRHDETARSGTGTVTIKPERIPFISYPYEWCPGQLRAAAQVTLRVQQAALEYGMSLKDASAFNVQFVGARPVFIDTASFEVYEEGRPWVAYSQFCRHFVAPLALAHYRDPRLLRLLAAHLDGIPLDLTASLLPFRTKARLGLGVHIHLQASAGRKLREGQRPEGRVGRTALLGLLDGLSTTIARLETRVGKTSWTGYYGLAQHEGGTLAAKQAIVSDVLKRVEPGTVWDLGANTGRFSALATAAGHRTVAVDADPAVVEKMWRAAAATSDELLLPLVIDLTNPTPGTGWQGRERRSLLQRGPADTVLALAIIHHLAIGHNVPLPEIATFLKACSSRHLVIEFVPKSDPNVVEMLANRRDIFADYTEQAFESAFDACFHRVSRHPLKGTGRVIYHFTPIHPNQ
jgi:hypothetical protein